MTEFDHWRLARQEAEQLLQTLAVPAIRPVPSPQLPGRSAWHRPAQAARAALRRLRFGTP